jgi:DNA-binding MarR family transcriptional regulator
MDLQGQRDLLLLSELDRDSGATQRTLATKLGVALGLTNLYLRRLARKGYIHVTAIPRNRTRYLLTSLGVAEKTRLTHEYMEYSLSFYREMRLRLKEMLSGAERIGGRRFVVFGTGELAELVYLSLRELGGHCVGFVDERPRDSFLSYPVVCPERVCQWEFDAVLIADLESAITCEEQLVGNGVPQEKVVRLGLHTKARPDRETVRI